MDWPQATVQIVGLITGAFSLWMMFRYLFGKD